MATASEDGPRNTAQDSQGFLVKKNRVKRLRTLVVVCLLLSLVGLAWRSWIDATARQFERTFVDAASGESINYLLNLPRDYHANNRRWPLLLFLHGSGERGNDLEKIKGRGPLRYVATHDDFPFLLVCPQARPHDRWEPTLLAKLLDEVASQYRVDEKRIYLTGYSMGGGGTWSLAIAQPNRFAAIAPVCGYGDPAEAPQLKNVAVWAFHGAQDKVIPLSQSENMVGALRAAHGNAQLTIYPNAGHNIVTQVYQNPELYTWLLNHKRQNKP